MRRIYLDIAGKTHSLYTSLINYPPYGYEFVTESGSWDRTSKYISNIDLAYYFQKNVGSKLVPMNLTKAYFDRFKKLPENTNLIYSSGHLVFRKEPWVVDLEFITHLSGYNYGHFRRYKSIIERSLKSENCKRIMPWTDAGKETIFRTINDDAILDKVETVNLAVGAKKFVKRHNNDKITILFVGSINIPKDFDIKGGKEVLEAFAQLNKKYDNIDLTIRSFVPEHTKQKYKNINNIHIIDEIIPWDALEKEFQSADIFLFPSHHTPGLAILDAMSYELPVITTDVWANPEMVKDGETGFLVNKSKKIDYYIENFIPNWSSPKSLQIIKNIIDPEVVNEIVEKASILIEDENLREKMGKAGRREIENGIFSIKKRNEKLKEIFDEGINLI